jgi:hypothetical protein
MSLPAAMTGPSMMAMASVSPIDSILHIFNTNPYFIGIMMLILNFGGRFISLEITKKQELFLQHPVVRRILIFTVLFVATRSIWVAFWTTVAVIVFLGYLFNENSALCIFGEGGTNGSKCASTVEARPGEEMTPEEKDILQRLSAKAQRYQSGGVGTPEQMMRGKNPNATPAGLTDASGSVVAGDDDVLHSHVYAANLKLLRG